MADGKYRELERRAASGDPSSEAKLARERCRLGQCCAGCTSQEKFKLWWAVQGPWGDCYPESTRWLRKQAVEWAEAKWRQSWRGLEQGGYQIVQLQARVALAP